MPISSSPLIFLYIDYLLLWLVPWIGLVIYGILKWIIHKITKKSQLERLCSGNLTPKDIYMIKNSLAYSKTIFLPNWDEMEKENIREILIIKKISKNSINAKLLDNAINRIIKTQKLKNSIIIKTRIPVELEKHKSLLNVLWYNLKENNPFPFARNNNKKRSIEQILRESPSLTTNNLSLPPPSIPDPLWESIGFQGSNPLTDFRGMGLYGLEQLVLFTSNESSLAKKLHLQSLNEPAWYSFAIVGINISSFLVNLSKSDCLDNQFYANIDMDILYSRVFRLFGEIWTLENPSNIMEFNRIFEMVKREIIRNL